MTRPCRVPDHLGVAAHDSTDHEVQNNTALTAVSVEVDVAIVIMTSLPWDAPSFM
jgi:hypothetical protein